MGGQHPLKGGITPPPEQGGRAGPGQQPPKTGLRPLPPQNQLRPHFLNVVFINQSIKNDSECRLHWVQQFQPIRTLHSGHVIKKYHLIGAF